MLPPSWIERTAWATTRVVSDPVPPPATRRWWGRWRPWSRLRVGYRVRIFAGSGDPTWLGGRTEYQGRVVRFIPGRLARLAAVVRLDDAIRVGGAGGDVAVLELISAAGGWGRSGTVRLAVCDAVPGPGMGRYRCAPWTLEGHVVYAVLA